LVRAAWLGAVAVWREDAVAGGAMTFDQFIEYGA
jgi:hypothetical protein